MELKKLDMKDALAALTARGYGVEADQYGIKRVTIDGMLLQPGYSAIEVSIPKPPTMVKAVRLSLTDPDGSCFPLGLYEDRSSAERAARTMDIAAVYEDVEVPEGTELKA